MKISNKIKNLLKTLAYYFSIVVLVFVSNILVPGDMCNPGLGILIIILAPFLTIVLIIRNYYLLANGQQDHIYSLILHSVLIISAFIIYQIR